MKTLTIIIVVGLLLVGAFFVYRGMTGNVVAGPGEYDSFAQCLTDSGAVMYGTDWCSFCQRQKDLFENSFRLIDSVDCDRNRRECQVQGVSGFPTWKINGQLYPGLQSLERLSELTGCEINESVGV